MSSVWVTMPGDKKKATKIAGNLSKESAERYLGKQIKYWLQITGCGHHEVKHVDGHHVLLYCNGELRAMHHLEHLSPPTKPGLGETRVSQQSA